MKKTLYAISVMLCIWACAEQDDLQSTNTEKQIPINIGSSYPGLTTRSVIDGGFSTGDEMGIFVVDRNEEGYVGEVQLQGNRASNMRFTLQEDGSWASPSQLYWSPKGLAADIYGYYPFDGDLSSVETYPFVIIQRQDITDRGRGLNGYIASDLLWAKQENVSPTAETIYLQYHHLMAGVCISLEKGTGFTADEWINLEKTILLKNTQLNGSVNLTTGTISPTPSQGVEQDNPIVPIPYQGQWRAVVFPQTVSAGKELLSITIDGQSYTLTKNEAMNFLSGKMHSFTIQVDKTSPSGNFEFSLLDEAVTDWVDDADMHEGLVRQYIVAEVSEAGTLATTLEAMGLDAAELLALKIVGPVNGDDYQTICTMKKLTHLNLIKAIPEDGALYGIEWMPMLEKVFFPEKGLKYIDCFNEVRHLTGSLIVPEGVVEIGGFFGCSYTGALTLPTTIKKFYMDISPFKGELIIPDGLEEWTPSWGANNVNITGTMYLPQTLKKLAVMPPGLTGTINIPQGCEIVSDNAFVGSQCTSLVLPEGLTVIPHRTFQNSEIRGEVRIPSTVTKIISYAFAGTKMSRLILPDNIKEIEEGAFADCSRLSGTLTIPKKLARISNRCFQNCQMLTGIVFHKDVQVIDRYAFAQCTNLNSIVCEGKEPPFVVDDAFLGVPKDNFTVEVPKGCVEKYRQAHGWSDFKRIAEHQSFVCRPAQVGALNSAHNEEIVLNADDAWTVVNKPDWVTLSKTSGTGKTALTLTVQQLSQGQGNREDTVKFEMNGYTTSCVVRQYDYKHAEDSYLTLQTATKGNRGGIDIVFVGDGWDGESISNGSYLDLVEYQTECFFAIEPYRSMRDYFNVYVTFPLSQEKGVNTMYTYVNNRFGTLQGMSSLIQGSQVSSTSNQLFMETDEVEQYVLENTPVEQDNLWRTLVIAVPNSTEYEGNTVFNNSGLAISICPPSEQAYPRDTRGTIQHEAGGHGFAKLGDESISRNAFATASVKQYIEDMHGRNWYTNLATTGKLHDVPWAEFIFDPVYSDYVDVYEGGYGYTRGIYRPESNSCMNYGIPYYNTPSRLEIYKRIKDYAGESFSMEEFRTQDTFEWGPTTITRSAATDMEDLIPYTNGNHHVPTIIHFHEMGDKVRAIRKRLKEKNEK